MDTRKAKEIKRKKAILKKNNIRTNNKPKQRFLKSEEDMADYAKMDNFEQRVNNHDFSHK